MLLELKLSKSIVYNISALPIISVSGNAGFKRDNGKNIPKKYPINNGIIKSKYLLFI